MGGSRRPVLFSNSLHEEEPAGCFTLFFLWLSVSQHHDALGCLRSVIVAFPGQTRLLFGVSPGADPGFLERGFVRIKVWGFALLILSHFS